MKAAHFTFTAPEDAGLSFKKVVIKETTGKEELRARQLAKAAGEYGSITEELLKLSIVSIDGKAIEHPFAKFEDMTSKDRAFIGQAWNKVNSTAEDLMQHFLSTATMTA